MRWATEERTSFDIALLRPSSDEGVWTNVDEVLATRFVLFNQGIMIRRDAVRKTRGFDERLRLLEDHELALRLSLEGPWTYIREPLVVWRQTAGSLYHTAVAEDVCRKQIEILQAHLNRVAHLSQYQRVRRYLAGELKRTKRNLVLTTLEVSSSRTARVLAKVLRKVESCRAASFRRSPSFPKMKVLPVNG
jgi:hypothetical protein